MSVAWLAPAALLGLVLVALPVVVHLLARHQARQVPFPSLRFLEQTQLAALRRRKVEDIALLICRALTIVFAVLALAGPVFQSTARSAAHATRISRAVVLTGSIADERKSALSADVFRSATFQRAAIGDAVTDALLWLDAQPASAREVMFAGPLHRDDVTDGDVHRIPVDIGIRFDAVDRAAPTEVTIPFLTRQNGALVLHSRVAQLSADATRVIDGGTQPLPADTVSILAGDQLLATAALDAALDAGVPWREATQKVVLAWEDADAAAVARARSSSARVVTMAVPRPIGTAADAVMRELERLSPPEPIEPVTIADAQLQQWSRKPGPPSSSAPIVDEGDRRWLWLAALALLALEWWLRRSRPSAGESVETSDTEVRVA